MKATKVILALGFALFLACGEQITTPSPTPIPSAAAPSTHPAPSASASLSVAASPSAQLQIVDGDFVENDGNRDPFRSFLAAAPSSSVNIPVSTVTILPVILKNYSIDELKLVAIILSGDYPRALFIDPTGQDYILRRGMLLGKPEIMHPVNSMQVYPLYWKVDAIKSSEVVLIREDPTHPEAVPIYREIPLHLASETI